MLIRVHPRPNKKDMPKTLSMLPMKQSPPPSAPPRGGRVRNGVVNNPLNHPHPRPPPSRGSGERGGAALCCLGRSSWCVIYSKTNNPSSKIRGQNWPFGVTFITSWPRPGEQSGLFRLPVGFSGGSRFFGKPLNYLAFLIISQDSLPGEFLRGKVKILWCVHRKAPRVLENA